MPTRDLVFDRGMMGDGVIDIPRIRSLVEAAGFAGAIEVEIMSERNWWTLPPDDVVVRDEGPVRTVRLISR